MRFLSVSGGALCALLCCCLVFPAVGQPCAATSMVTGTPGPNGIFIAPGPTPGTTLTITVRNCDGLPMAGVTASVTFHPAIRVCTNATHYGVTNTVGVCTIQMRGGGCVMNTPDAGVVWADGVKLRSYPNVKSPDNAAHNSSQSDLSVLVTDLGYFADEFKAVAPPGCHDYDNDGDCDVVDLTYFGDAFKLGVHCQ
jgi:hypothetical protein